MHRAVDMTGDRTVALLYSWDSSFGSGQLKNKKFYIIKTVCGPRLTLHGSPYTLSVSSWRCRVSSCTVDSSSENWPQVGHVESRWGHTKRYPWGPAINCTSCIAPWNRRKKQLNFDFCHYSWVYLWNWLTRPNVFWLSQLFPEELLILDIKPISLLVARAVQFTIYFRLFRITISQITSKYEAESIAEIPLLMR